MPVADSKAYGSSWYAATAVASPPRGRLSVELDVDVCIVGAGLAGLTAAREVARRGWSVVVLEAARVASGASGRNTGFVLPGYGADLETIVSRVGRDGAKALWALSEAGVRYVRDTVAGTGMPGVELTEGGWLHVSKTDPSYPSGALVDLLAGDYGTEVEAWSGDRVRSVLKSPHYFGALHYPRAFSVHPLNYALGLAAAAEAAGARICEETPALEIDPAGVRKRVVTPNARVRAAHVVLAGNIDVGGLMPEIAATLLPVSTYVLTTSPLGERLGEAIAFAGAVSDSDLADNHYRVVDGDRLMWSGRSTVWRGDPQRHAASLTRGLARTFPQLKNVSVEYAWTGTLGFTVHRMPQIGELSPGLWLLSGFGGHGLNTTAMGGELIARAIVEDDKSWRQFLPFELVWAGGLSGRAAAQTYYWAHRTHERIAVPLAHKRDVAARHDAERRRIAAETAAQAQAAKAGAASGAAAVAVAAVAPTSVVPEAAPAAEPPADEPAPAEAAAPPQAPKLPEVEFVPGNKPG